MEKSDSIFWALRSDNTPLEKSNGQEYEWKKAWLQNHHYTQSRSYQQAYPRSEETCESKKKPLSRGFDQIDHPIDRRMVELLQDRCSSKDLSQMRSHPLPSTDAVGQTQPSYQRNTL